MKHAVKRERILGSNWGFGSLYILIIAKEIFHVCLINPYGNLYYIDDLENIIEFVDKLNDVDTSDIEPLTNPLEKTAKTRDDQVTSKNLKQELLEIAPSSNEDYFLVPRVVE